MPAEEIIRAAPDEIALLGELMKFLEVGELAFETPAGSRPMPDAIRQILKLSLAHLAEGGGIAVLPLGREVTPRQAAEILGVSRPFVVRLLKEGQIPSRTVGTHHRIALQDLLSYKRQVDEERRRALDLLARESEEMGAR
ncbi:MAG TPA: helix-turn-helix domain-containing protein [Actinomycetota bacterium]|nr:helix-turn-helix domain-containing protein [Actinomycetota bacterium]